MGNAALAEVVAPKLTSHYRDEMNFAEFPLAAITNSVPKNQKTLVFRDEIFDVSQRKTVERTVKIAASDEYGLPTALDDEVIVGLIQLTAQAGFASKKVHFTRYELIELLGWRDEGKSYERIEQSLKRWLGVTLYYNKAWWSKEESSWVDEAFHIVEHLTLYDRERRARRVKADSGDPNAGKSFFVWNDVVFKSFTSGYIKRLDFALYTRLSSAIAKRMYRFLDKRFYRGQTHTFDLRTFACSHLGISSVHHNGKLKYILRPAIAELEQVGFLAELAVTERFVRRCHGEWDIVFTRAKGEKELLIDPLAAALVERGLSRSAAQRLMREHERPLIEEKIRTFDLLLAERSGSVSKNPAGFLYKAIVEDYQSPKSAAKVSSRSPARATARSETEPISDTDPLDAEWLKLSADEQVVVEQEAIHHANGFLRVQYEKGKREGGTLFQAVRHALIRAYLKTRGMKAVG